ncbi:hypothetical protein O6H91_11G021800 [Diphasiastrum complanatum]|uniref:Uncharacterized protein n=1 Tax=Diphasiastrum complanatum TaxID=34168 RepID=A0ACC2C742_DIPCM|nr:hypothetical protein O6H91_Y315300 [Diphasiastrum complanatum]KAJ7537770.1 hypothetical protein O6H91_11G021800 [Diphasiastrum complanatum]
MRGSSTWTRARESSQRRFSTENENENPPLKKRKLTTKSTPCVRTHVVKGSVREALSIVSTQQELIDPPCSFGGQPPTLSCLGQGDWEGTRMATEEVEALLNMKMTGKAKSDIKGRNDQMMEYIKKLRGCIRQLLQVESAYILQKEQQQIQLQEERQIWKETETKLKVKQDELEAGLSDVNQKCSVLEEISAKSESARQEVLLAHQKDSEALRAAADERLHLLEEIEKLRKEVASATQQAATLQDINKRLQEYNTSLQQYNTKLQSDAAQATEENSRTQKEKVAILETLGTVRGNNAALQTQLDTVKASLLAETTQRSFVNGELIRLRGELQHVSKEKEKASTQLQALSEENARFRELTGKTAAEVDVITSQAVALEERYHTQNEQMRLVRQQLDLANQKLEVAEASLAWHKKDGHDNILKVEQLQKRLADADQKLLEGELLRRKLHNIIQELKGNIRVFCRVRPMLPDDDDSGADSAVQYPSSGELVGHAIELLQPQGQKYTFTFDKVFGPEAAQEDVFVEISQLVQSALDGYKVCIFAYGQTGSGKTHTMLGHPDELEQRGVIPRSVEQIFQSSQALQAQGWKFKMQASMLEIYNETIRDLLVNSRRTSLDSQRSDGGTPGKQHVVKHEPNGNTFVTDLTVVEVTSWKEVSSLLRRAAQSRSVGKTAMNDHSSRSHCVFTLRIAGTNENTEQQVHGVLNLIDLAGSERLSRSCATGERLRETQAINKSLSSLGDVILAIGNKEQHIPYRNSKLTYLLQPCLGGDSKTLMFVNIAPESKSLNESLCSLRFAAKVNACEIGVPRRHTNARLPEARLSIN